MARVAVQSPTQQINGTGITGSAWFCSAVRPTAPGVRAYVAAPPRGMTNPPQNRQVREALLQDLHHYGIALEAPKWPPTPLALPSSTNATARPSLPPDGASAALLNALVASGQSSPVSPCTTSNDASRRRYGSRVLIGSPCEAQESTNAVADAESCTGMDSPTGAPCTDGGSSGSRLPRRKLQKAVSDAECYQAMESLRTRGRIHRAVVDERFRSGAELVNGGSQVVAGAQWHSDGCHLNSMHNKAMRGAYPSRLSVLHEKSKKNISEGNDCTPSGCSRLTKYRSDSSLQSLRDLRFQHFPPTLEGPTQVDSAEEEHKKDVAEDFKANLALPFLARKFN